MLLAWHCVGSRWGRRRARTNPFDQGLGLDGRLNAVVLRQSPGEFLIGVNRTGAIAKTVEQLQ
jgi:hypothetical protein